MRTSIIAVQRALSSFQHPDRHRFIGGSKFSQQKTLKAPARPVRETDIRIAKTCRNWVTDGSGWEKVIDGGVRLRLTTKFTSRVSESRGVVKSVASLSNSRPASADAANPESARHPLRGWVAAEEGTRFSRTSPDPQ